MRRRWRWLAAALTVAAVLLVGDRTLAGADAPGSDDSDHSCTGDAQADDGGLLPDECWGAYPTSNYDVGFKDGNSWAISRKIFGGLTELAFHAGRSVVQLALWLITWAYSWDVENVFGGVGTDLSMNVENSVVDELLIYDKVWFVAVAWAGFVSLRGRVTNAASEMALSFLLAILGATLIGNLDGYRNGALYTLRDLSLVPLVLTDDDTVIGDLQDDTLDDAAIRDRLLDGALSQLHEGFVEQPHDVISWGRDLSVPGMEQCADLRDDILGHVGSDDHEDRDNGADERDYMRDNGCEQLHRFNEEPTAERLFSAVLYVAAATVLLVLLALTALTVVLTKMFVIGLFALAPLVAPFAVVPGGGRRLVWSWLSALARSGIAVAGVGFVLSLMLMTVDALLGATNEFPLYARFFLIDMLVVTAIVARKRVLAAGQDFTQHLADRVASRPVGNTAVPTWMGGPGGPALGPGANMGPPMRVRGAGDPVGVMSGAVGAYAALKWGQHRDQVRGIRARHRFERQQGKSNRPRLPKRVARRVSHPVKGWKSPPRTRHRSGGDNPKTRPVRSGPPPGAPGARPNPTPTPTPTPAPASSSRTVPRSRPSPTAAPGPRSRSSSPLPDQSAPPPSGPRPAKEWPDKPPPSPPSSPPPTPPTPPAT